ncbi:multidrug effflux MFS transporter [Homoserinimonas hongtaonis]|uniref:multidrug effflux MFS transporter n=1 Tax=Homoserinimonas hongtaonis TaxID=2079791 RepID=UPI00131F409A|nr:multidrug effflux MFS transporter [Salinibacterium hongtaonis]
MTTSRAVGTAAERLPLLLLITLGTLTAISTLGTDIYLAAMPKMSDDYMTTPAWVQATLTAYVLGMAVGQLVLGTLSDTMGRRRLLIIGTAVSLLASALSAIAPTIELMLLFRLLAGIGASAGVVIGRAVVSDLTAGAETTRVFSILGLVGGVGPIIGPVIGAVMLEWSAWPVIFWTVTALCAVALAAVFFFVPESLALDRRASAAPRDVLRSFGSVVRTRSFVLGSLMVCLGVGATFAYISSSPFIVQSLLGFSPTGYTIVFAANGVGMTVAGVVATRLAHRTSAARLCLVGLSIVTAGGLALLVITTTGAASPLTVLPTLALVPIGMGLVFGPGTALVITDVRHAAGTALALLGSTQYLFGGITAPLAGIAGELSILPLAIIVSACGTGAIIALLSIRSAEPALRP